jgi:hypothetical protein
MFCFNILFESRGQGVGGIRGLSAVMSVNTPLLEGRVRQRPLKSGFGETLDGILCSDMMLEARDDCALLIRR